MPLPDQTALWDLTARHGLAPSRMLSDGDGQVRLADLAEATNLEAARQTFCGRSVLISSERQLPAVLALLHLDGVARRVLLCPPDLSPLHLPALLAEAEIDLVVSDGTGPAAEPAKGTTLVKLRPDLHAFADPVQRDKQTDWLLLTSGTTGQPKIVLHNLASLTGPLDDGVAFAPDAIWSTFYDVRRYGGLQMLLRALLGGSSMVLSQAKETVGDFLIRAARSGVTHMSGTPSHWRRALMSPAASELRPAYVRLSGEVADQAILDSLAKTYPNANIAHAFASTEAGVAFDVRDGLAGFPASLIGQTSGKAEMRVQDGSLRIRSARTASRYIGDTHLLMGEDGFVDTGDMVELRGDRYHFVGRREGIINVGGQKVHPEEVEAVVTRHPSVQMARARARRSPITGAIVVADVVLQPECSDLPFEPISAEILQTCRDALAAHKVPVMLYRVPSLEIAASGKLVRARA